MTHGGVDVAETHSAVVFFVGDRAYKLKKPVNLGFLDFRTRQVRQEVCHREVELNRRLSPDVYLGVADVIGPDREVCDHFVVMRRMPAERRLSTMVSAGEPVNDQLRQLARLLASLHSRPERSAAIDKAASAQALAQRWIDNTTVLLAHSGDGVAREQVERVHDLAMRYLAGRQSLFDQRIADGRACDGHGDLLADDIFCLDDGPRVLDCIEFNDQFRYGDGVADVAFLAMDLERLGRVDLADSFLAAYREHADDAWPVSLAHHHVAYRAQVRAKVSAIRADQGDEGAITQAQELLEMSQRHLERGRVRLVLVGGLPGTGKSTIATGLGEALDATVLRSDEMRKELAGLPVLARASAPYGQGLYSEEATERTYETLLERAAIALGMGETVVLDASWSQARHRVLAWDTADRSNADLVELRCEAPAAVAADRLARRAEARTDPSDATPAIAAEMARNADPWPSATPIKVGPQPQRFGSTLESREHAEDPSADVRWRATPASVGRERGADDRRAERVPRRRLARLSCRRLSRMPSPVQILRTSYMRSTPRL